MRLPFRRKGKKTLSEPVNLLPDEDRGPLYLYPPTYESAQLVAQLPSNVLQRIFAFVCPHACDESYETCEESASDQGCMLCDLRDLAHCVRTSKQWRRNAVPVLYHSVRIDPVHYCRLEAVLAERRKKTSRFDRNGIPEDPAQARLRLLRRSVRDDPTRLGKMVEFLKIPYMLRESSHVELAQTIAVLPNLHYVDLPEGMFSDEPSLATLRLEVQARCPNIRKTTYMGGSEQSLRGLATGRIWPHLEVLELSGVSMDPASMRNVLVALQNLRALKVSDTNGLSDEVLVAEDGLPSLPPLQELVLQGTPRVTSAGLMDYLSWVETQEALRVLTLIDTGVHPSALVDILAVAPSLRTLAVQAKVAEPFPQTAGPHQIPMSSRRLETLRYEISGAPEAGPYAALESSYYGYLATSILSGGFPNLRRLYVLDETMPDQLQGLPPPSAAFSRPKQRASSFTASSGRSPVPSMRVSPESTGGSGGLAPPGSRPRPRPLSNLSAANRLSSNNPFAQSGVPPTHTLELFTKSEELGKWNFASVSSVQQLESPTSPGFSHQRQRPVSSFGLGADVTGPGWEGGEARRSVMIGSGTGPFLAVPGQPDPMGGLVPPFGSSGGGRASSESWRPRSSGGDSTKGDRDLWR